MAIGTIPFTHTRDNLFQLFFRAPLKARLSRESAPPITLVRTVAAFFLAGTLWADIISASTVPDYSPPPGALNPQVTQANIAQTICVPGWTRSIRPPAEYTHQLKRRQIAERHLPGRLSDYEEDHLIPLNLGGHPTSPDNLWPQPIQEAQAKDKLEYALNRAVCAGRMTLAAAQQKIKEPRNWR